MDRNYELPGGIAVNRMQPAIGAIISGVDLHAGWSDEQAEGLAHYAKSLFDLPDLTGLSAFAR